MNSKNILAVLKLLSVTEITDKPQCVYSSYKENKFLVLDDELEPVLLEEEEWNNAPYENKVLAIHKGCDPEYGIYRFIYDVDFDPNSEDDGMDRFLGTISKEDLEKNGITITSKEEE